MSLTPVHLHLLKYTWQCTHQQVLPFRALFPFLSLFVWLLKKIIPKKTIAILKKPNLVVWNMFFPPLFRILRLLTCSCWRVCCSCRKIARKYPAGMKAKDQRAVPNLIAPSSIWSPGQRQQQQLALVVSLVFSSGSTPVLRKEIVGWLFLVRWVFVLMCECECHDLGLISMANQFRACWY